MAEQRKNRSTIELIDLVKIFGKTTVLKNLNLKINQGEFITLLGASGSGKTTALRLIGGFEYPTRGEILFDGKDVKDLPSYKRPTNTIFQDYALFPHLNVEGNVKYGLKLIRVDKEEKNYKRIEELKILSSKWKIKADKMMKDLDTLQKKYENILQTENPATTKFKKARKWMDSSDFTYSYWETYTNQKIEIFSKKHLQRKLSRSEINEKYSKIINIVGLKGNDKKAIDQLSGGMKQRVALARALVTEPKILLLDEPLSALDLKVRQKMQKELKNIQKRLGLTFIFVTHDQEEAMTISDKIAIMRDGRIEQFDIPQRIYEFPINSWVADFIGESNIFNAKVISKNKIEILGTSCSGDTYDFKKNSNVKAMIRPEDITLTKGKGYFKGKITSASYLGTFWEYIVKVKNNDWIVQTTKKLGINEEVSLKWTSYDVHTMKD